MLKAIKWKIQRVIRGYSDCDLWNLDIHLSEQILKPLKAWRKMGLHGYPAECASQDEWLAIIDEMIDAFELIHDDLDSSYTLDMPEYTRRQAQIKHGLSLFAMHFQALWD